MAHLNYSEVLLSEACLLLEAELDIYLEVPTQQTSLEIIREWEWKAIFSLEKNPKQLSVGVCDESESVCFQGPAGSWV